MNNTSNEPSENRDVLLFNPIHPMGEMYCFFMLFNPMDEMRWDVLRSMLFNPIHPIGQMYCFLMQCEWRVKVSRHFAFQSFKMKWDLICIIILIKCKKSLSHFLFLILLMEYNDKNLIDNNFVLVIERLLE